MKTSLFFSFVSKMFQVPYNMTIGLEDDIIFLHVVELSLSHCSLYYNIIIIPQPLAAWSVLP